MRKPNDAANSQSNGDRDYAADVDGLRRQGIHEQLRLSPDLQMEQAAEPLTDRL